MRRKIIAGNWKMNKTIKESVDLACSIYESDKVDVIIAPVFTALYTVKEKIGEKKIKIAAQNVFSEEKGPYTGEISTLMLKDAGCSYVIIGHSERRKLFCESDETVNGKIKKALNDGLKVIFCIGELLEDREVGKTNEVLWRQLTNGLKNIEKLDNVIIAYEPVWAIGTGLTATAEQVEKAHNYIRERIKERYNEETAERLQILYGGSVKPENVDSILSLGNVDGALVGGASLSADEFNSIIQIGEKYSK